MRRNNMKTGNINITQYFFSISKICWAQNFFQNHVNSSSKFSKPSMYQINTVWNAYLGNKNEEERWFDDVTW